MSLVFRYKFDEPTASLTSDSSGNSNTLTNDGGVVSAVDATYGNVASFSNASGSNLVIAPSPPALTGNSSKTICFWIKRNNQTAAFENIFGCTPTTSQYRSQINGVSTWRSIMFLPEGETAVNTTFTPGFLTGVWYHIAITYDGTTEILYVDGSQQKSEARSMLVGGDSFTIGGSPSYTGSYRLDGYMSDFRAYDNALSATEITTIHTEGPNPVVSQFIPGVTSISATVVEVTGALTYQINITESPSGTTWVAHTGISTGNVTIGSLTPGTTYVLQLYADIGSGYVLEDTELVTTLENSSENYNTSVYGSDGVFDLSTLNSTEFALLGDVLNDVFTTGDKLGINLGSKTSDVTFVKVGDTVSTDDSILVPFSTAGGAGQAITINLSDTTTTVAVSYDDVNNSLTIGSDVVQIGDSIVIDGKKLTVKSV